jgi:hypothetical protein
MRGNLRVLGRIREEEIRLGVMGVYMMSELMTGLDREALIVA